MTTNTEISLETKFTELDPDVQITDDFLIEGYASRFGQKDQGGDIVQKGAFTASLSRLAQSGTRVKMLWQHDQKCPIGVWDEVFEDNNGLFVRGRLLTGVALAQEAADLVRNRALDGLSIGYKTLKSTKNSAGQRVLTELDLWEVSLVTFPMLTSARIATKQNVRSEVAQSLVELADLMRQTAKTFTTWDA